MCDCINKVEEKFQNSLNKTPQYADLKIKNVFLNGIFYMDQGVTQLGGKITIEHEPRNRKTKTDVNVVYHFCPFCGKAYGKAEVKQ